MESPSARQSAFVVISVSTVLSIMFVFGLLGNLLVCIALYRNRRLRTVANIYVLFLALADLLEILLSRPFGIAAVLLLQRWPLGYSSCQFNGFIVTYWCCLSISTLAMAAGNRYLCLIWPQKYKAILTKTVTLRALILLWIFLFLLGLFITLFAPFQFEYSFNVLFCRAVLLNRPSRLIFLAFSIPFIFFPIFIIMFCYGRVLYAVKQHVRRVIPTLRAGQNTSQNVNVGEFKTVRILLATTAAFCLSWTPIALMSVVWFAAKVAPSVVVANVCALCSAASSFINPIIYGGMNRAMRKEFARIICCRR